MLKADYLVMLGELDLDRHSRWTETKKKLDSDPRYKAIDSSSRREDYFRDYVYRLDEADDYEDRKVREKKERVAASLKEREKEVRSSMADTMRERNTEREKHLKGEALTQFKALLADLVRNADTSWRETKKLLKRDSRWSVCEDMDRDEREKVFDEHVEALTKKNKEMFHKLLNETEEVTLTSTWKDIKKLVRDDPRYSKFSSSERKREAEFEGYIREKYLKAKQNFRDLLKESMLINHQSHGKVKENKAHLDEIKKLLQHDKRYLVLECVKDERDTILTSHLEDLERKGRLPPPTATDPALRIK